MRTSKMWVAMKGEVVANMEALGLDMEKIDTEVIDDMTDKVIMDDWIWDRLNEGIADIIQDTVEI